jgi:branched-chain amino acid transport system permease protein
MSGGVSTLTPRVELSFRDPRFTVIAIGFAVLLAIPTIANIFNDQYLLTLVARMMIFAIAAASLDLILGYGGMVSFGHAAYLGLGAYAVGVWSKYAFDFDIDWMRDGFLHFGTAIVGSALFALVVGAICLRTTGLYFIMITLAFTQMIYYLGISLEPFGGDDGINVDRSRFPLITLRDPATLYYFILGSLVVAVILLRFWVNSRFGMVIRGAKSNEQRMRAIGFPVYRYRLVAFVLAGVVCGWAGALFVNLQEFLTPVYMNWFISGEIMIMVIMGGMATVFGPVIGAFAFILLEVGLEWLFEEFELVTDGALLKRDWRLLFGPMLVLLVLYARGGIFGALSKYTRKREDGKVVHD